MRHSFPRFKVGYILFLCLFSIMHGRSFAAPSSKAVSAVVSWDQHLSSEDRQMKHCKMSASPFVFYRGSNHLFWETFAHDTRLEQFGNSQTLVWIQGDLHAENFGAFDNAEGDVVYDLNDFDESVIADYQYDLWRMAISLLLTANEQHVTKQGAQERILDAFGEAYLDALKDVDASDVEMQTVFHRKNTSKPLSDFLKKTEKNKSRKKMLKKWTQKHDGERHFDFSLADLEQVPGKFAKAIEKAMPGYMNTLNSFSAGDPKYFRIKSLARRLHAGTGSLGTPRYYALIEGESDSLKDDRILDIKRQGRPTPYRFLGKAFQQKYTGVFANDAQRHALAYRALSLYSDPHCGWMRLPDGLYSVRERSPYKASFPAETLGSEKSFRKMATQWGRILAYAHARADRDSSATLLEHSFEREVLKLTNKRREEFLTLLRTIAFEYAGQVESDWRSFVEHLGESCRD